MNPNPRSRYTTEFKAKALALLETSISYIHIDQTHCISSNLLPHELARLEILNTPLPLRLRWI